MVDSHTPKDQTWTVMNNKENKILKDDVVYSSLTKRWFELAAKERFPKTKKITAELDTLQLAIAKRKEELLND